MNNAPIVYSRFNLPKLKKQKLDNKIVKEYGAVVEKGKVKVKVIRQYDINEYINSFASECDIYNILKRFQNGDLTALNQNPGFYGDIANMPNTLLEVSAVIDKFNGVYNSLNKDELKEKYNIKNVKDFIDNCINGNLFIKKDDLINRFKSKEKEDVVTDNQDINKDITKIDKNVQPTSES